MRKETNKQHNNNDVISNSLLLIRKEEYGMKGSKLFKNVRLKGQKELVSILVEDGIFKKSQQIYHRKKLWDVKK